MKLAYVILATMASLAFAPLCWSQSLDTLKRQFQVLERLDRDQNQQLESEEVPEQASKFISHTARKIRALSTRSNLAPPLRGDSPSSKEKPGKTDVKKSNQESKPPFDLAELRGILAAAKPTPIGETAKPKRVLDEKTFSRYASSLILSNDQNGDGFLSGEELKRFSKDAKKTWDANRDGKIESAEIAVRLRNINSQASKFGPAQTDKNGEQGSLRVLPFEFSNLDKNADGQIQMFEFAQEWDDRAVEQFGSHDANHDGVITQDEWLKRQVKKHKSLERKNQQHD